MKKLHFILVSATAILLVVNLSFCKKGDRLDQSTNATIYDAGSPAADGCGWIIRIDSTKEYSPINLSEDYKKNGLKITLDYKQLSSRFGCGMLPNNSLQQIQIIRIAKR